MRMVNALLMVLGALAVLALGTLATPGLSATASPHCQTLSNTAPAHGPASVPAPGKAVATMSCCVTCTTASALSPPLPAPPARSGPPPVPGLLVLPVGRTPSPEHGPPRG